jgi:hypothetical protein
MELVTLKRGQAETSRLEEHFSGAIGLTSTAKR